MTKPTILVATWRDGLFVITGDGRRTQEFGTQPVRGLAPDGLGGALAIVDGQRLCRRAAGGEWSTVTRSNCELSCCMAVRNTIYLGTDDARLLRLRQEGGMLDAIAGFDTIAGRDDWFAGSAIVDGKRVGPPLGIRSVSANSDGTVLYANVHVGGIPRSVDGGRTWEPTIDINSDVHEVCAHPTDPNMVAAASAIGLCVSGNAGETWTIEKDGLHAPHCSAVAFAGDDILISASTDPFAEQGRLYRRSVEPDGKIAAVEDGLPMWMNGKVDTGCIVSNSCWIAVIDGGGNLYVSTASGRAWSPIIGELPGPSGVLIC